MINMKELRQLAQAATPGPWKVYDDGLHTQHIGDVSKTKARWLYDTICNMYEDVSDNYDTDNDYKLFENSNNNTAFITAANPAVILELLDRLEAAEKELDKLWTEVIYWRELKEPGAAPAATKAGCAW